MFEAILRQRGSHSYEHAKAMSSRTNLIARQFKEDQVEGKPIK